MIAALIHTVEIAAIAALLAACIAIVFACICRVNLLHPAQHRRAWSWCYIAVAAFALGLALDMLHDMSLPKPHVTLGLLGIAASLYLSRSNWSRGVPPLITHHARAAAQIRLPKHTTDQPGCAG